jgi:acyl carrier protein
MTDSDSVAATVLAVLSDVLSEPAHRLHVEPVLAAHGWDSMASLEALAQLESQLGVAFDLRSFHAARTVGDLVELARAGAGEVAGMARGVAPA